MRGPKIAEVKTNMTPKQGPIVLAEDDIDDREIITESLRASGFSNDLRLFENGRELLDYLRVTTEKPLIILCDINMPVMNGFQLRHEIQSDEALRRKSIPFIFLSTDASPAAVEMAYELTVQGFFKKPSSFDQFRNVLKLILDYWCTCKHVNSL
jgi:CheY-like chemotaxis protein